MHILLDSELNGSETIEKYKFYNKKFVCKLYFELIHTVNPWAISSSGTSSGRNRAGVIQGHLVLIGSSVTITSPLAKPSRTRPDDNSIVRKPCSFGDGVVVAAVENDVVTDLFMLLFFVSISITAGLDDAIGFGDCGDGKSLILM